MDVTVAAVQEKAEIGSPPSAAAKSRLSEFNGVKRNIASQAANPFPVISCINHRYCPSPSLFSLVLLFTTHHCWGADSEQLLGSAAACRMRMRAGTRLRGRR